jgi:lipoyl(octanoyl) transferase
VSIVPPDVEYLGRAPYERVLQQMRTLQAEVHAGRDPGRILLVEHDPVYTAGRATPPADLREGIVPIERGGKITYHGPGQLVVYPIVPLPRRDLRDWLRRFEALGIAVAAAFGVTAKGSVDGTGVFANGRKFASIGIAVKHWVSMHGIGINIAMELEPWYAVQPCGLSPDLMTDLSRAAGRPIAMHEAVEAARAAVLTLTANTDPV